MPAASLEVEDGQARQVCVRTCVARNVRLQDYTDLSAKQLAERAKKGGPEAERDLLEVYGLFGAADDAPVPSPKAFALKSVCDFADEHKNDDLQSYAAYTSARALQVFMETYLGGS